MISETTSVSAGAVYKSHPLPLPPVFLIILLSFFNFWKGLGPWDVYGMLYVVNHV